MTQHYNLYTRIHKAIRGLMSDTLVRLGRMDESDACEVAETLRQVRDLLQLCRTHLNHENRFVHPALEKAQPHSSARTAEEHAEHEREIAVLEAEVTAYESRPGGGASAEASGLHHLYLALAEFVGENFVHMHHEETVNHAILTAACSFPEIIAIERAIVASLTPEQSAASLRLFLKYTSPRERAGFLLAMKPSVPSEVFGNVLQLGREVLSERDWFKLQTALAA